MPVKKHASIMPNGSFQEEPDQPAVVLEQDASKRTTEQDSSSMERDKLYIFLKISFQPTTKK